LLLSSFFFFFNATPPTEIYTLSLHDAFRSIHLTFSPVVDVNNNPLNPIINTRSFGEDPRAVARLATAYIRGAQEHGLFATAKHLDRKSTRLNSSHSQISYAVFCLKKKKTKQ